jgi:prophage regulatory protein
MTDTQTNITSIDAKPTRLLRIKEVVSRSGLSKSTVYDASRVGDFPRPVKLSPSMSAWVEAEVDQWIADRIAEREAS